MNRVLFLLIALNIAIFVSPLFGEEEMLRTMDLDLEESLDIALKRNTDILVARERLKIAEAGVGETKSSFPPKVDFSTQYTRRDLFQEYEAKLIDQSGDIQEFDAELRLPEDEFKTQFSLTAPIYTGGRLKNQLSYALSNERVVQMDYFEIEQRVLFDTKRAYNEVLRAKGMVSVYQEAKRKIELNLKDVESQHESGLVKRTEVLSVKAKILQMEQNLMKAENRYDLAITLFNRVLGIDLETEVNLEDVNDTKSMHTGDMSMALAEAYSNRPDWKAMEARVKMVESELNLAKVQRHPLLDIRGDYTWSDEDFPPSEGKWGVYIIGRFALYDGSFTEERIKGREAQLRLIRLIRDKLETQIAFEVKRAFMDMEESEKLLKMAKKNVDEVARNLEVIKEQFKKGQATSVDVIEMEMALVEAKSNYIQTRYAHHLARAQFLQIVGRRNH